MAFGISNTPLELNTPLAGFRFSVSFLTPIPHPMDFRFQSVSGLSVTVNFEKEGEADGERLPKDLSYTDLVLKRGMPTNSSLSFDIQQRFNNLKFTPGMVMVSVLDENALPLKNWLFNDAMVSSYSISGLDASTNAVLIEEIKLSYKSFKSLSL